MKKTLFILAGLAALGGMGVFGTWVAAQNNGAPGAPAANQTPATMKIGLVNIVKVLKGFDKANFLGETLINQAKGEEANLKKEQEQLTAEEARIAAMPDKAQRENAAREFEGKKFRFSQVMTDYRKRMSDKQGEMALEVNDNITRVIDVLAKTRSLELVLVYPDLASEKEAPTPALAFQRLSPPAATVAWKHPGLDITDHVIATLNHNFPSPAGTKPASATAPAGQPPR